MLGGLTQLPCPLDHDRFYAIDSRPGWWTGPEAGDWSPASTVDRDCASGLVSSLVISVVVRRSTGWGHTGGQSGFGRFLGPAESGDRATASVMSSSPLVIMSVITRGSRTWTPSLPPGVSRNRA